MARYELDLPDDIRAALGRLAQADDRTLAGTVRHLIRDAAVKKGLWQPGKPQVAPRKIPGTNP